MNRAPIIRKSPRAAYNSAYYERNAERLKAASRLRNRTHPSTPEANRARHLRRTFGITPEEYDALLAAQGGLCAVCRQPETALNRDGSTRRLAVDHNHETGAIRGLTCLACNRTIGYARDDPAILEAAADYLRQRE